MAQYAPSDEYARHCFEARVYQCRALADKAIAACARAESLQPKRPEALLLRALILDHAGRDEDAESAYARAVTLAPACAEAYALRAIAWYRKGDYEKSIADCDRALDLDDTLAMALIVRGDAKKAMSTAAAAPSEDRSYIEDYSKAMAADSRSRAYVGRGFSRDRWADFEAFVCEFSSVVRIGAASLGQPLEDIQLQTDVEEAEAAACHPRNGPSRDYPTPWSDQGTRDGKRGQQFAIPKYEQPQTKDPSRPYERPWAHSGGKKAQGGVATVAGTGGSPSAAVGAAARTVSDVAQPAVGSHTAPPATTSAKGKGVAQATAQKSSAGAGAPKK